MSSPTIADYLKYSTLQMAAEALLADEYGNLKNDVKAELVNGNLRSSKFTQSQAEDFSKLWQVVDQCPNTATGFSGTLFRAIKDDAALGIHKDDLVVSFRSTEFIDDSARDSEDFVEKILKRAYLKSRVALTMFNLLGCTNAGFQERYVA